ncbi:MAG: histidinol-phosphatase HisJ family protein [Clostridia bacterium]|nr:histidinol-phosphatase HisJ family protein [Clostridia bacterium]
MIYKQNLHTHSTYCDGKNSLEDVVLEAIHKGFESIGFSSHSDMPFSSFPSLYNRKVPDYKREITALKEKYQGKIKLFCGVEWDMLTETDFSQFEYVLGAKHYFDFDGEKVGFDRDSTRVREIVDTYFGGDGLRYAKRYYEEFSTLANVPNVDIVAHFDLIAKHSQTHSFFDEESKEYQTAAIDCLKTLVQKIPVFEINTGAMARGYRTTPYLAPFIMKALKSSGAKLTISSDCHQKEKLDYAFDDAVAYAKAYGFNELYIFNGKAFDGMKI